MELPVDLPAVLDHEDRDEKRMEPSFPSDAIPDPKVGDWIATESDVVKLGGNLGFVRCQLKTPDAVVARANATFKIG